MKFNKLIKLLEQKQKEKNKNIQPYYNCCVPKPANKLEQYGEYWYNLVDLLEEEKKIIIEL